MHIRGKITPRPTSQTTRTMNFVQYLPHSSRKSQTLKSSWKPKSCLIGAIAALRHLIKENICLPCPNSWFWRQRGEKGGFSKILKFNINIEICVEKSKESSGALCFSIFSILSKLYPFLDSFLRKFWFLEVYNRPSKW